MEKKIKEKEPILCRFSFREVENIYITGWILDFYNRMRIKKEHISDLISEIVEVPIKIKKINNFNNNKIKKCTIYAGIRDIKQDPNNYEVEPIVNYEFTFDESQEEIENKEENENKKENEEEEEDFGFGGLFG